MARLPKKSCVVAVLEAASVAVACGGGGGMFIKKLPCPFGPVVVLPCCSSAASRFCIKLLNAVSVLEASAVVPVVVDDVLSDAWVAAFA